MKNNEIKTGKQSVSEVFYDWYTIPSYQRDYVWEDDQVNDFLKDMCSNCEEHPNDEYFFGSYIKQQKDEGFDLLDGQQRITTLFLFFAFLRDYSGTSNDMRDDLQSLIYQKENKVRGIPAKTRLDYQIRGDVDIFISKYIVPLKSIESNWEEFETKRTASSCNVTIRHICNTLCCFRQYFLNNDGVDIEKLIQFVNKNVVMIYVSADSLEDSFRLFSVMNDRGLKLSSSDILKSSNLEHVGSEKNVDYYARKWEELQSNLGDDLDRFLMHLRNMILKSRVTMNLLDEYEKNIFKPGKLKQGVEFFETVLRTYDIYDKMIYLTDNQNVPYCNLIRILQSSMVTTDWIPVIMLYYQKFGEDRIVDFTKKVICKYIADTVCGVVPSNRIMALNKIMLTIESVCSSDDLLTSDCFSFDQEKFRLGISSDIYGRAYAKPLLMLLEYKFQDNSIEKAFNQISIEHILPQNPDPSSKWRVDFTDELRTILTHKIGNLFLIGRRKNSSLGNLDYTQKRSRYFEKNINSFARSLKIYNQYPSQWTPLELASNQISTLKELCSIFGIDYKEDEGMKRIIDSYTIGVCTISTPE